MGRRLLSLCAGVALAAGCWSEEPLIHGAFTAEQWATLQQDFTLPARTPCAGRCSDLAAFGQQLFFEPALSGPWVTDSFGNKVPAAKVSCATCHDAVPNKAGGWYVDTRADNAVSIGAERPTAHNTISLVNVAYGKSIFTWSGECTDPITKQTDSCTTPSDVVRDIALPKAMSSDAYIIARAITTNPQYAATYRQLFPLALEAYQRNVEAALDAYMTMLVSIDAPFDRFIAGDPYALDESATRGFALFVGRAMCYECHRGPFFSDNTFRVTGVIDAKLDKGRGGSGAFFTAGLRHVAETGPYMHNGSLDTLADVIWFYREGGAASGYHGAKDPLMAPLDITDDEAKDLEAFLRALTGQNIISALRQDTRSTAPMAMSCQTTNGNTGLVCDGQCLDVVNDRYNCGACGNVCMSYCMAGLCGP